jgi:uncharacterized protein
MHQTLFVINKGLKSMSVTDNSSYVAEIEQWRQVMDHSLRSENGWLSLVGLHWLKPGLNTIGSSPAADIPLPDAAPSELGTLEWANEQFTLKVTADAVVTVDDEPVKSAGLRDDAVEGGASIVRIGSVSFFVIRRGDEFAVRVRDTNNPDRQAFTGRKWFPLDTTYRVAGKIIPHDVPRTVQVINSAGQIAPMKNPAQVEFVLNGQTLHLEAFSASNDSVWFVFKDATSGQSTYGAGRFMYATPQADGSITLDFNRSYHPPCAYTPYATCPRPLPENILPIPILAGEHS